MSQVTHNGCWCRPKPVYFLLTSTFPPADGMPVIRVAVRTLCLLSGVGEAGRPLPASLAVPDTGLWTCSCGTTHFTHVRHVRVCRLP